MKALVLSALLLHAVHGQDEEPTAGQIVEVNVDNGSTLPPGAAFTDPTPTPNTVIPPGSNDIVLPSEAPIAPIPDLGSVLASASSVLGGARFGLSVEPVSRSLSGIGNILVPIATGRALPGRPAPILAPGPKFPVQGPFAAPSAPTATSKAKNGGFSGLSVDEGDLQPPEDVSSDPEADPPSDSEPVDGQSADTPVDPPADESGSTPTEDQPGDEQPTDTEPVNEQPAETPPADEQPADSQPLDDPPVDHQPTDTQPADEQPTDTPPVDDQPVDDQPTETQPAEEQPTDQPSSDDLGSSPLDDGSATPTDEPTDDTSPSETPSDVSGDVEGTPTDSPSNDDTDSPEPTDDPITAEPVDNGEPSNDDLSGDPEPNPAGDPQPLPEDDPATGSEDGGDPFASPGNGGRTGGNQQTGKKNSGGKNSGGKKFGGKKPWPKPGGWPGGNDQPGDWPGEPWEGGKPGNWKNNGPAPLPIGPSGWENEDNGAYDGEDYGDGPNRGHGQGKKPSGTGGNGRPGPGYETDDECPSWCWDDDSSPIETSSAEPTPSGYKTKHKRKKSTKASVHRIAVSVDDNVIYDSNYARRAAADPPSSGGFKGFTWPDKHTESNPNSVVLPADSIDYGNKGKGQGKSPSPYGHPYPYEETTDHPYDSQYDQNTDYDDKDQDDLPQWLTDLHKGTKDNKGKKGKKKAKGKCPKTCTRKPYSSTSTQSSEPTATGDTTTTSEDGPTSTDEPTQAPPTTFITITTEDNPNVPSTDDSSSTPTSTGRAGLPAGYVTSGDTWTGSTLASLCPKQCNPFNPAENFCDTQSTGCTTSGGSKYYCACRAGYKLSKAANKDFSQQFKVPGQPYVYTWPGAVCDELCDDPLCNEIMLRAVCV